MDRLARARPARVRFLAAAGAEVRIEEFPAGTHTAEAAAEAVGCALGEIVKSLVFEGGGRSALALVPGDRRADSGKIAGALGVDEVRVASPERVRELTGFEPGAVAPFGSRASTARSSTGAAAPRPRLGRRGIADAHRPLDAGGARPPLGGHPLDLVVDP